jgi:selenocysteine lyase/cysteine desulfurase
MNNRCPSVFTRRRLLRGMGGLSLIAAARGSAAGASTAVAVGAPSISRGRGTIALPDKANFPFDGTHLNAAYAHPVGIHCRDAAERYIHARMYEPDTNWPVVNARDEAVALFASLINAQPGELAVVPSTLEGENLIAAALGLSAGAGVVTDPFHYDASLVMYGELHKRGMPLRVIAPRLNGIDYADLEAAITGDIRLVAVSLVSSDTGYMHDLKTVCDIAHRKGALVYADIIQAVGAIPLDVKASGVDFCCAGAYKWLMGEFGAAFLYVRSDRLAQLKRVQIGWRGLKAYSRHYLPFDSPGPTLGDWELGTDTGSVFEVSTPNWSGLATIVGSLNYINGIGVDAIRRHCDPMLRRLQEELPQYGFTPLTPNNFLGPSVVFSSEGVRSRLRDALQRAKIYVTLQKNKIRISPSVHNDMGDIDRLLRIASL